MPEDSIEDVIQVAAGPSNAESSESTTMECIVEKADVLLEIRSTSNDTVHFKVSSRVLCAQSRFWYEQLKHIKHDDSERPALNEVKFEVERRHVDAMRILLNLAHQQFGKVPSKITVERLVELAQLCDKYGTADLVRRSMDVWISALRAPDTQQIDLKSEDRMWIGWVFDRPEMLGGLTTHLLLERRISDLQIRDDMPMGYKDRIIRGMQRRADITMQQLSDLLKPRDCQHVLPEGEREGASSTSSIKIKCLVHRLGAAEYLKRTSFDRSSNGQTSIMKSLKTIQAVADLVEKLALEPMNGNQHTLCTTGFVDFAKRIRKMCTSLDHLDPEFVARHQVRC